VVCLVVEGIVYMFCNRGNYGNWVLFGDIFNKKAPEFEVKSRAFKS
jgi:hypothetical protein